MRAGAVLLAVLGLGAAGCGTPRVSLLDPEIRDKSEAARVAYNSGQVSRAAELYGLALDRARLTDSRDEVARTAYNLALCRLALGRPDEARSLLAQAEALTPVGTTESARVRMAAAEAAAAAGRADEAAAAARGVSAGKADAGTKAQAHLLLAELARRAGDAGGCEGEHRRASESLRSASDPLLQARSDALAAWLARKAGREAEAGRLLERQAGWLKKAGLYRTMGTVLAEAAEAFQAGGDSAAAADCGIRAAQCLAAQGDRAAAVTRLRRALDTAQKAGDERFQQQAAALLAEMGEKP